MLPKPLTRDQVREIDRRALEEYGVPGLLLMENAGRSCVLSLLARGCRGPVVIACGKGNNGGDGLVIARHLDGLGIPVKVLLFADPVLLRGDAETNYQIIRKCQIPLQVLNATVTAEEIAEYCRGAEWIVDALLGTGAKSNPQPPISLTIDCLNAAESRIFAVDLPSGLDCDSGEPGTPTVKADVTCTFVAKKFGFESSAAQPFLGSVDVVDIGIPRRLLNEYL